MIRYSATTLEGVFLIEPPVFEDHRGLYIESYNDRDYRASFDVIFVQDDFSYSAKNVLRGIHGDSKTWKLVSCVYGKIYLVVVNCCRGSECFGKWESFILSKDCYKQILIPPLYGNGHLALTDEAIFHYKQSEYYDPGSQFTYHWNDPRFDIWWPTTDPILSRRDSM